MLILLQTYPQRGLWGAIDAWLRWRNAAAEGRFTIQLPWSLGLWRLSPRRLPEFSPGETVFQTITIHPFPGGYRVQVPLALRGRVVLGLEFATTAPISDEEISWLREVLELLLRLEASDPELQPSWLPFMFPLGSKTGPNAALLKKQRLFFLNGQAGSGKSLFVRNYYIHHGVGEASVFSAEVTIPELALAEEETLALALQQTPAFIASAYAPEVLVEQGLIDRKLAEQLLAHQVVLHTPRYRPQILEELEEIWLKFKLFPPPLNGGGEIRRWKQNYFSQCTQIHGWPEILQKTHDLRGAIENFEYQAVLYAKEIAGNSQHEVARFLGISRGSLQHKLRKWKLTLADD